MNITNNYSAVIVLPPDIGIAIGGSVEYPNWDAIKDMPNIAWHVEVGNLSVDESDVEESEEDSSDESESEAGEEEEDEESETEMTEDEHKEALIAQLAEFDIKADKRSSVETLQQKLDEALAK